MVLILFEEIEWLKELKGGRLVELLWVDFFGFGNLLYVKRIRERK